MRCVKRVYFVKSCKKEEKRKKEKNLLSSAFTTMLSNLLCYFCELYKCKICIISNYSYESLKCSAKFTLIN